MRSYLYNWTKEHPMKTLAAQALAYQYKLQIETAKAVINNNNAGLDLLDRSLNEIIQATEKLKALNDMAKSSIKEVEKEAS